MAVPTIQSRVAAMGQKASNQVPNPQYPAFWSGQNLKNFGNSFLEGAGYGAQGGMVAGAGIGAYNAANAPLPTGPIQNRVAQIPQPQGQAPQMSPALQNINQKINTPTASNNPSFLGALGSNLKQVAPQLGEATKFFDQFRDQPKGRQAQMQPFLQGSPVAQSGPSILTGGAGSSNQSPYFSFEKFFTSSPGLRPLIGDATGMPQNGTEDDQRQVRQQQEEQQKNQMEQWGAPESGFGRYAHQTFDWLGNSPWAQRIVGAGAVIGANYLTSGAALPASGLIASGAGGAFKGLSEQLRNFFAVRTNTPQQQQQNPSILAAQQAGTKFQDDLFYKTLGIA